MTGTGGCVGANCGTTNPDGKPPGEPCTTPEECLTGRCEPVTGTEDVVCIGACFADGVACTRALDCCSTGCFDGACGGLCTLENEDCERDSDCCSNICAEGRCAIDEANPDCRPTGEDCTSGTSRGCCHECDESTDRCGFGADTCRGQGATCNADGDCCRGVCDAGTCRTPCTPTGEACADDADCCTASCSAAGTCDPPGDVPPPPGSDAGGPGPCVLVGERCTTGGECCSGFCFGGFCEPAVR
jgi:hypothetical protein